VLSGSIGIGFSYLHFGQICLAGLNNNQKNISRTMMNSGQNRKATRINTSQANQRPQPEPRTFAVPSYLQFGHRILLVFMVKAILFNKC